MKTKLKSKLLCLCLLPSALCLPAFGQGTAFTYQGRLNDGGGLANGLYDLRFVVFDGSAGGSAVGLPVTNSSVNVSNGLFTVTLDFGSGVFTGPARWLEIGVRSNGNGTFSALGPRQTITPAAYAVFAGNVNAAGIAGPIADGQLPANIARLDGSATFTGPVSFSNATGNFSGSAAGLTNLNITSGFGGGVGFELGATAFFFSSSPVVGDQPSFVLARDVNGDGKADLISANFESHTLTVLTNTGSGKFVVSSSPGVGIRPYSLAAADVNGDGKVDLISGHEFGNALTVLTNNGSGGFVISSSPVVGDRPQWVAAADVNGDLKVDLIAANYDTNKLTVLTNNGSGLFALASSPTVGNNPYSVTTADVNGDGKVDLISANIGADTLSVVTNNGSGGFVLASSLGVGNAPQVVTAADVNRDDKVDLISANQDNTLTVLTNTGGGGFVLSSSPSLDNWPFSVTAADVNGDGKVDLVSPLYGAASLAVLTNDGSGGFSLATAPAVRDGPASAAAADFNGDGRVDLVSGHFDGGANTLTVLFNSRQLNGVFAGNGTGLTGVNAESLGGFDGSDFARLAASQTFTGENSFNALTYFNGDTAFNGSFNYFYGESYSVGPSTFNGNVALGNSAVMSFGTQTRQMLNLWGSAYGVGVQSYTLYHRSDSGFAWFRNGTHSDTANDPGGGTRLLTLDGVGELHVGGGIYAGLSLQNRETTNYVGGPTAGERWVWYASQGICRLWSGNDKMSVNNAGTVTAVSFNPTSDRRLKENFAPVSSREVLDKVAAMPISRWNFKGDADTPHLGPMAQDFHAAFGLGTDDKHIATVDADGVALAAIQGLNEKVESQHADLRVENRELKARLFALEKLVANLNSKGN